MREDDVKYEELCLLEKLLDSITRIVNALVKSLSYQLQGNVIDCFKVHL